jgi:hypothetical protein
MRQRIHNEQTDDEIGEPPVSLFLCTLAAVLVDASAFQAGGVSTVNPRRIRRFERLCESR